jgi:hypothetical protein
MGELWPWLAVAGLGALHGLNPAGGWPFAAAWGRRALLPLAAGHLASVGLVAGVIALGLAIDRRVLMLGAGALLPVTIVLHRRGHLVHAAPAGLALWSFVVATAHGAGLMLVPALIPLCLSDVPARAITASGSLALALAAVGVHLAAMLCVTALLGSAARRVTSAFGWAFQARRPRPGT